MEVKICNQCKIEKSVDEFYKQQQRDKNDPDKIWYYYDSQCKACRLIYSSDRRRQIKIQIVEYKGSKCEDCGIVGDPVIYDCHHLDPSKKDFTISKQAKSFEKIKSELDKCVLLCANCHRLRHKNE